MGFDDFDSGEVGESGIIGAGSGDNTSVIDGGTFVGAESAEFELNGSVAQPWHLRGSPDTLSEAEEPVPHTRWGAGNDTKDTLDEISWLAHGGDNIPGQVLAFADGSSDFSPLAEGSDSKMGPPQNMDESSIRPAARPDLREAGEVTLPLGTTGSSDSTE